jgi:hypothetical protein
MLGIFQRLGEWDCRIELKILLSRGTIEKRIFETIQEHFATAVIRTFLGNLFCTKALGENAPRIVFTIPREEIHEMGALLAAVTADQGWGDVYLR